MNKSFKITTLVLAFLLLLTFSSPDFVEAKGHGGHSKSGVSHSEKKKSGGEKHYKKSSTSKCTTCKRDKHGKIKRSPKAKNEFKKSHPCPSTGKTSGKCPGYVIDHKKALKHGGADDPSNMQWQTTQDAKAKDKWE